MNKFNNSLTIQDQLKFLIDNLEQDAGPFTTDEGRKARYNSLLVEIKQINLIMRRNIQLIQDNTVLFPSSSLFKTDFLTPKDLLKTCQELFRDNPLVPARLIRAIDELRDLLQEAEVSHEERSSTALAVRVQHSDTVSQQQEEASVDGMAAVESKACRGAGTPRQRLWLWLLPWLLLFLCAGFFLLKKRFGWPP
jgi:hypothetical protein